MTFNMPFYYFLHTFRDDASQTYRSSPTPALPAPTMEWSRGNGRTFVFMCDHE